MNKLSLPQEIASAIKEFSEYDNANTKEYEILKDADFLECMVQALEYKAQGHADAQNWFDNAYSCLRTESGKKLAEQMKDSSPTDWFKALKRIER